MSDLTPESLHAAGLHQEADRLAVAMRRAEVWATRPPVVLNLQGLRCAVGGDPDPHVVAVCLFGSVRHDELVEATGTGRRWHT